MFNIFSFMTKFCYSVIWVSLPFLSFSVADLGEGPRGAASLISRANGGLKGRTNLFLETAPPPPFFSQGLDPVLLLASRTAIILGTVIHSIAYTLKFAEVSIF